MAQNFIVIILFLVKKRCLEKGITGIKFGFSLRPYGSVQNRIKVFKIVQKSVR